MYFYMSFGTKIEFYKSKNILKTFKINYHETNHFINRN